jgi:replicative DNA helicase
MPFDEEAERAVLGCMLFDEYGLRIAVGKLCDDDFFLPVNRTIFAKCIEMDRCGKAVNLVTVKAELSNYTDMPMYLTQLYTATLTSAYTASYCNVLLEKSYRRRALINADLVIDKAYNGKLGELGEAIDRSNKNIVRDDELEPLPNILQNALKHCLTNKQAGKKLAGASTGYWDLDDITGGLEDNSLIIVAGRPSMGKTAFALNMFYNVCKNQQDKLGIFFSLEMSKEQLALRLYSSAMRVPNEHFKFNILTAEDLKKMQDLSEEFESKCSNIYIDDNMDMGAQELLSSCYNIRNRADKDIGIIVIDYIQIMQTSGNANRTIELGEISRSCKKLSKVFNCPVVVLSQVNRCCEQRQNKRPILSDLRESGNIEQDADLILFLYRDEVYNSATKHKGVCEVIIAKQRNGAIGTIELGFAKQYSSFYNLEYKR